MTENSLIYRPADWLWPLAWEQVFGRAAPVEVDIGTGKGAFILTAAAEHPDRNFLGLDRLLDRLRRVDAKAHRRQLANIRLLRLEAGYFVRYLIPPASVATYHIYCPDPWPKRRHRDRRLINPEFVADLHRTLETPGLIQFSTDDADYFAAAQSVFRESKRFCERVVEAPTPERLTDFERLWLAQGLAIHRSCWEKR